MKLKPYLELGVYIIHYNKSMNILNGFCAYNTTFNKSFKAYSIESTIVGYHKQIDTNDVVIICNPKMDTSNHLLLNKNHPDFEILYNKLQYGKTYKFIYTESPPDKYLIDKLFCNALDYNLFNFYNSMEVIDILECEVHRVCGIITGLLDLENECDELINYKEIIIQEQDDELPSNNKKRIILEKNYIPDNIIGKLYSIDCVKTFGYDFYTLP